MIFFKSCNLNPLYPDNIIQYKKPSAKKGSPQNTRNHIWVAPSKQVVLEMDRNQKWGAPAYPPKIYHSC